VFERMGCRVEDAAPDLAAADEIFAVLRGLGFVAAYGEMFDREPSVFKDTIAENLAFGRSLTADRIGEARRARTLVMAQMHAFFERYDVLALPVNQVVPFSVDEPYPRAIDGTPMASYMEWMHSCSRITVTGHPAISVPCAFTPDGLPVGLQLVGRYRDDWGLLQIASAFEQATRAGMRRPPAAAAV
jgi:amidase